MDPGSLIEVGGRLLVAAACGGVIGLEREAHAQAAGLRTHMVLAVGAALVMIVSLTVAGEDDDPGRIAAHVVSGIGFLGAGAILRLGATVRGLTTAACLWTAAGIGLAVGAGMLREGLIATGIVFLVVWGMERVTTALGLERELRRLRLGVRDGGEVQAAVREILQRHGMAVRHVRFERRFDSERANVELDVICRRGQDADAVIRELVQLSGVDRVVLD